MADYTSQIESIYLAYYGRPADVTGLAYWNGALNTAGGDLASIINSFGTSAESTALYSASSNVAKINAIYQALFNRNADAEGLIFYAGLLDNGTKSQASIALDILNGAQNDDLTLITKKLVVSADFTAAMQSDADAMVAYSGTTAAATARAMLEAVTADSGDVDVNTVLTTIISDSSDTATAAAQTFTLTTDTLSYDGEAGVDTFNGGAGVIDGMNIDGAAGSDILNLTVKNADDDGAGFTMSNVETMNVRVSGTGSVALDLSDVTGLDLVNARRLGGDLTLEGMTDLDATYEASNISVDGLTLTLDFDGSAVSGTADTVKLAIDSVTASTTVFTFAIDDGIEGISLDVSGTGNVIEFTGTGTAAVTSLEITGTGDLSLDLGTGSASGIVSVDASAYEGDLSLTVAATAAINIQGGSGDDSIDASSLTAASTSSTSIIDGGAGDDTIVIAAGAFNLEGLTIDGGSGDDTLSVVATATIGTTTATVAAISGIETLLIDGSARVGAVSIDLGAMGFETAVDTVEIVAGGSAITTVGIDNMTTENLLLSMTGTDAMTVTASLTTTTGTADAISISIGASDTASSSVNVNLNLDEFESISLDLSNTSTSVDTESVNVDVDSTGATSVDIVIESGVTANVNLGGATALAALVLSGAGDVNLTSVADGAEIDASDLSGSLTASISGTAVSDKMTFIGGSGDDTITIGDGRFTVDMGAGDDTLTVASDLSSRDSFDGGAGTDTIAVSITTATSLDLVATDFEIASITLTGADATVAVDQMTALTAIEVTVGSGDDLTITGIDLAELNIDVTGVDATGTLTVSLATTSGTSEVANLTVASTTATALDIGTIDLVGFETVNLDVSILNGTTSSTTAQTVEFAALTAASATSLVITGDDDNLAVSAVFAIDLADGATIDLTGFGSGAIGGETAATTTPLLSTSSSVVTAIDTAVLAGGLSLNGTENVTLELGDGRGAFDVITVIDLGAGNNDLDTINFNNSSADADDEIGTVIISNFLDRTNNSVSKASVIDLSDFDVSGFSDLSITGTTDAIITSDNFAGAIILVGVDSADLAAGNFVFSS